MGAGDNFLVAEAQLVLDQVRFKFMNLLIEDSSQSRPSKQARKEKAERVKTLGEPVELPGKALAIEIHDGIAWVGENTTVVRKLDLEVRCAF